MATFNEEERNGWTAVPIDASKLFNGKPYRKIPSPLKVTDISFPHGDPIVSKIQDYAKEKLPIETYNHSMRVYYYGKNILRHRSKQKAKR